MSNFIMLTDDKKLSHNVIETSKIHFLGKWIHVDNKDFHLAIPFSSSKEVEVVQERINNHRYLIDLESGITETSRIADKYYSLIK